MSRDTLNYTHGDTGTEPTALNFEQNERPIAGEFDWYWYNVTEAIKGHAEEFDRLDEDNDGVVDAADGAATWSDSGTTRITHPTDVNFVGDISVTDDGDGTVTIEMTEYSDAEARSAVDGSSVSITGDADTVDGQHASAFADAGHLHDGRYILENGDTMGGDLSLGGNDLHDVSQIDGNGGNHRIRFDETTDHIQVADQSNNPSKLAAKDLFVDDGIGWLSNAVNGAGARNAVDGSSVSITGDAGSVDGWDKADIQNWVNNNADVPNADYADSAGDSDTINGKGVGELLIYSTVSDAESAGLAEGTIVYVQETDDVYIETSA